MSAFVMARQTLPHREPPGGRLGPWWLCLLLTRPANPQCLAWLRGLRVGPSPPLLSCSRPGWHWDSVTTQRGLPRGTQCWTAPECRGGVCLTHVGDLRPCHSGRTRSPGPIFQTTHWSPEKGSDCSGQALRPRRPHSSQAWARVWGPLRGSLLVPLRLVFSAQKLGWDQGLPLPPWPFTGHKNSCLWAGPLPQESWPCLSSEDITMQS